MIEVALKDVELPDFGLPEAQPEIPAATYESRLEAARRRAAEAGLNALLIYGDREHSANLAYLTGFEPRFEEALLVLPGREIPTLVVGNECWGYAEVARISHRKALYQPFSLMGQRRSEGQPLQEILTEAGVGRGNRVGIVGWKTYAEPGVDAPERWVDAPSYLVEIVRSLTGNYANVVNTTDILTNPSDGLRTENDVDQLAAFEFAACHTSTAVRNVLFNLRPGRTEFETVQLMGLNGLPWSCHLMLSAGPRAALGLGSPGTRHIERGDPFTTAYGVWGALNCRAGFVVESEAELSEEIRDYVERLVAPYFRAVVEWYRTVGIGVTGGELFDVVERHLGDPFFGVSLNPGHLIHLDEWGHSPIFANSDIPLRSGMALQVDIIPATGSSYFTTNIEDGIALADEGLRAAFAAKYPDAWGRIEARREFMADTLGIRLKPEVLPFSNIPAYLPPFLLRSDRVMVARE